jgi:anti-sigma regulatory factor (Ser/Thr protein kinase)
MGSAEAEGGLQAERETPPEPGGDVIIGAALEGLRRAAQEVEVERSVAATLQRSILRDRLPAIPGLAFAARYLPGSAEAEIGGDWYDAIPLRDGKVGLAIGDVVGRGIGAAARMAHLQGAVRAYALEGLRPSVVLERTDAFAQRLERPGMATLLYAILDPETATLRFASAGHPPPLVIGPDREDHFAEGRAGAPVGTVGFPVYEESVIAIEPGATVLLYTDGLVERSTVALAEGMESLREAAAEIPAEPGALCRLLPETVLQGPPGDDTALLAVRLEALDGERIDLELPADSESLAPMRRALARWLKAAGAGDTEAYEILVATGEACANAIAHAYPAGDASFELSGSRAADRLEITVRDHGTWRPPRGELRRRGLTLMETLMDEMEVDTAERGTTVTLRRGLRGDGRERQLRAATNGEPSA